MAFVQATSNHDVGTTASDTIPAGPTAGNVLIAAVGSADEGTITPNQTGWTTVLDSTAEGPGLAVYARTLLGTETGTYSWTVPGYGHGVVLAEYSELDMANLLAASHVTRTYGGNASDATVTAPAGATLIAIASVPNMPGVQANGFVTLTGGAMIQRANLPGYYFMMGFADEVGVTAGSKTRDAANNADQWFKLVLLALNSGGAPPAAKAPIFVRRRRALAGLLPR